MGTVGNEYASQSGRIFEDRLSIVSYIRLHFDS